MIGLGAQIDDAIMLCRLSRKHAIEPGPAVCFDLRIESAANVEVASWSKFEGSQICRPGPQTLADVVPRNNEVAPIVGNTTNDDMDVGIVSVPMFGADPVELGF